MIAGKTGLLAANVTVTFHNRTVTSDGILPDYKISKVLLDSAHDAMPYYQYFKRENITPFIDLNGKGGRPPVYKNDFTIDKDDVPVCLAGYRMQFVKNHVPMLNMAERFIES